MAFCGPGLDVSGKLLPFPRLSRPVYRRCEISYINRLMIGADLSLSFVGLAEDPYVLSERAPQLFGVSLIFYGVMLDELTCYR